MTNPDPFAPPPGAADPLVEPEPRQTVYANRWISVEHADVLRPDGSLGVYGLVRFAERAVGVLPLEDDGSVWLVGQWRKPMAAWSWEMPEGGCPAGEAALDGAKRELAEETGFSARHWVKALEIDLLNAVCDQPAVCFIAWGLTAGEARPDPTEVLHLRRFAFRHLLDAVCDGRVRDSMSVATVLRAHHMAMTGQLPDALARAMLAGGEEEP